MAQRITLSVAPSIKGWCIYRFEDRSGWLGVAALVGSGYRSKKAAVRAAEAIAGGIYKVIVSEAA
jgi:hypothetical protein